MRYPKCGVLVLALVLLILLGGCGTQETVDPYEGMVQVETGFGNQMWIRPIEGLPVNGIGPEDFSNGVYIGGEYEVRQGIDVSEHQGEIDWEAVAADGIDFAIIRAGYRGYSAGGLFEDICFHANMKGAMAAGLDVGVYFFSQAINAEEAAEEAEYLLELMEDYGPSRCALPVFYDWESIGIDEARTDGLDGTIITDCALAFCEKLSGAGYDTGIYFYRNLGYFSYDLGRLSHLSWWAAALNDYPDFYYQHFLWQNAVTGPGTVAGVKGEIDRNMQFIPKAQPAGPEQGDN